MANFYTDVIAKDRRFHLAEPCDDVGLLEPVTLAAVTAIIKQAATMGHVLKVAETYRSAELQQLYYQRGVTQLRTVGVHHYGLACDLRLYVDGKFVERGDPDYRFMRFLAESHGMISGVDWGNPYIGHSFRDYDHIQRVSLARQNDLFAGRWYPDANYKPLPDLHRTQVTAAAAPLVISVAAVA